MAVRGPLTEGTGIGVAGIPVGLGTGAALVVPIGDGLGMAPGPVDFGTGVGVPAGPVCDAMRPGLTELPLPPWLKAVAAMAVPPPSSATPAATPAAHAVFPRQRDPLDPMSSS